ncbi:MAG: hypothetical protein A2Z02_04395 [Chloroflexi bacterium RBG_16_48_7]|nr:MAG: hypothetical protein A2Z02_04395 [Chloroflexi bacterium RBG_16_48_7]
MQNVEKPQHKFLTTARVEALSDAIFAFAMTLLVLNLGFPDTIVGNSESRLSDLLLGHITQFVNYAIGFILIAIFWVAHHQQFHHIKRTDSHLIWINIVTLMFVALIPFSTDLVGDFNGETVADIFFACNLLIVGLFFTVTWAYAVRDRKLVDGDLDEETIMKGLRRNLLVPVISIIVIVLALFVPGYSLFAYWLVPLAYFLKPFR